MCMEIDEFHRKIVENMIKWNKDKKSRVRMIFKTELSRSHYTQNNNFNPHFVESDQYYYNINPWVEKQNI